MKLAWVMAVAVGLAGCVTTVPPRGHVMNGEHTKAGVYATVDGKTQVVSTGTWDKVQRYYPMRAMRLEWEDDVVVRCAGQSSCSVVQSGRPELAAPALNIAAELANHRKSFPVEITVSFRVISTAENVIQWAPLVCPIPGDRSPENKRRTRNFKLTGNCIVEHSLPGE